MNDSEAGQELEAWRRELDRERLEDLELTRDWRGDKAIITKGRIQALATASKFHRSRSPQWRGNWVPAIKIWNLFVILAFGVPCHAQCELVASGPIPLFWDANDVEADIDFYNVFRAESLSSTAVLLSITPQAPDPVSFLDTLPIPIAYYTVRAVDIHGRSSGPSNTLCVTSLAGPSIPMGFSVIADFSTIPLAISNLSRYQVASTGISDGAQVYQDRTYTYSLIPLLIRGEPYIITANTDKGATSFPFLTFDINQSATIYVAHDDRLTAKPDWMMDFSDTGKNVKGDVILSLFSKSFPPGQVALGGNRNPATTGSAFSMYGVIVK